MKKVRIGLPIDEIISMYQEPMSMYLIAKKFGVSAGTIRNRLLDAGISLRDKWEAYTYPLKLYATPGERFGSWTLIEFSHIGNRGQEWVVRCDCGTTETKYLQNIKRGGSTQCRECKYLATRGGSLKTAQGYILLFGYKEHANSHKRGTILEHILVMSDHLGRPLLPKENVHHLNGIRDDNRIENLELWSTSQPSGQRVEDKTAWAIEWLEQYGFEVTKKEDRSWNTKYANEHPNDD